MEGGTHGDMDRKEKEVNRGRNRGEELYEYVRGQNVHRVVVAERLRR